jgi:ABC-type dipeptide/oligopeptide/nickel transport system ATPase component
MGLVDGHRLILRVGAFGQVSGLLVLPFQAPKNKRIIVTHEIAFAHEVADVVAFMSDGVIVESGPPAQLLENPQNPRTRGFLARFHRFMGSFSAAG